MHWIYDSNSVFSKTTPVRFLTPIGVVFLIHFLIFFIIGATCGAAMCLQRPLKVTGPLYHFHDTTYIPMRSLATSPHYLALKMNEDDFPIPPRVFSEAGQKMLRKTPRSSLLNSRRFRAMFGVTSFRCAHIWVLAIAPFGGRPCHLLWELLFLKLYASENIDATISGLMKNFFANGVRYLSGA